MALPCSVLKKSRNLIQVGEGDTRVVTKLGFAHVTTKTLAYLGVFGFFRIFFGNKFSPPGQSHFENTMGNPFFETPFV